MPIVTKRKTKSISYLTKRILVNASRIQGVKASKEAMRVMGYVVVAENGWVVKKYADNSIERISQLATSDISIKFD
jgi:hypothetical protein